MGGRGNAAVRNSNHEALKADIRQAVTDKYTKYWKNYPDLVEGDVRRTMERVETALDYFKDKDIIEKSASYPDEIVWRFSGKDKSTGKWAGFEFDSLPKQSNARETLSGNGYSVSQGLLFPKPVFDYVMNHTNVTDTDIEVAKFISSAALKRYKKGEKR